MKQILVILSLTILISCKSKNVAIEKSLVTIISPSEIDQTKKNRANDLGERLLESCNTSSFKPFSKNEATEKVILNATPERISSTCQKINFRNGKYLGIKLIDVTHNQYTEEFTFRYAIDYEKKIFKRELFVTINAENKVAAISTKEVRAKPF